MCVASCGVCGSIVRQTTALLPLSIVNAQRVAQRKSMATWERRVGVLTSHVAQPLQSKVRLSASVAKALACGAPVVALESTIISHGMPYPHNLETARAVEAAVRKAGAVPATVAILDGVPCVGLEDAELERLARLGHAAKKTSRRDLPYVLSQRLTGATTVSATMLLAAAAGIAVFVTGGIGGVHRGASESFDISTDLSELARTPVAVVCAGAKSILDIPKTLEVLETCGVAVATFGSDHFPAFYTRSSGVRSPWRIDTPSQAAAAIAASQALQLGGMVLAVPIPESNAADGEAIEAATRSALAEASAQGLSGAAVTPFLLKRVAEVTGGESLAANIALVLNNATVGSQVAVELSKLRKRANE